MTEAATETSGAVETTGIKSVHDALLMYSKIADDKFEGRNADEKPQHYFSRIIKAVSGLNDEEFEALAEASPAAVTWFNVAVDAFKGKKDITAPEGFTETAPSSKKGLAAYNEARKKAKEAAVANGEAAPAVEKKTRVKKEKEAKEPSKRGDGRSDAIRGYIVANFTSSIEDLRNHLKAINRTDIGDSTITTCRSDALATLRLAKALGYYNPDAKPTKTEAKPAPAPEPAEVAEEVEAAAEPEKKPEPVKKTTRKRA